MRAEFVSIPSFSGPARRHSREMTETQIPPTSTLAQLWLGRQGYRHFELNETTMHYACIILFCTLRAARPSAIVSLPQQQH